MRAISLGLLALSSSTIGEQMKESLSLSFETALTWVSSAVARVKCAMNVSTRPQSRMAWRACGNAIAISPYTRSHSSSMTAPDEKQKRRVRTRDWKKTESVWAAMAV